MDKRSEVLRDIRALIAVPGNCPDGRLPPERDLASRFGVSRNLVREALKALEAMGLVEIRERLGAFVSPPGGTDVTGSLSYLAAWPDDALVHLMEARLAIEVPCARLAAERRGAGDIERIAECLGRLEAASGAAGLEDDGGALGVARSSAAAWDAQLHGLIVRAAGNPVLERVYEGLAAALERYVSLSRAELLTEPGWPERIAREHRELVSAIMAGDGEAAERASSEHLGTALARLRSRRSGPAT